MTLEEVRWMSELFETRKMLKAAENLFVSQPTLSHCLQRVEQQLGFPLFTRPNKGLVPTEKGLLFYEMSLTIRGAYDQFLAKTELVDQCALGSVVIGMPLYLSSQASTELLIQLERAFPTIHFSVYEAKTADLVEALYSNKIQMLIANEAVVPPETVVHPLIYPPTVIYLRAGSPLRLQVVQKAGKNYLDPQLLGSEPITVTKKGQTSRLLADRVFTECGITPNIRHETSHVKTLFRNAKAGISSSIGSCTIEAHRCDTDNTVICFVPEKYKWSKSKVAIYTLPEVEKLLPKDIYPLLKNIIMNSEVYYMGV